MMPRYEARPHPRPRIPSHLGVAGVGREVEGRGVGVEGGRADVGAAAEQLAHRGKVPRMARPVQRRPPVMCVRVLLLLLLLLLPSIGVRSIWCSSATPATTAATTTKNTATTKRKGNAAQGKCIARARSSLFCSSTLPAAASRVDAVEVEGPWGAQGPIGDRLFRTRLGRLDRRRLRRRLGLGRRRQELASAQA